MPLIAASAFAGAQTIDFDSVTTTPEVSIPNGFAGYDWSNFYVASPALLGTPYNTSGYETGLRSGQYVGVNGYGNPSDFSVPNGVNTITSVAGFFTAAWTSDDKLTIEGLVNNQVVQSCTYALSTAGPRFLHMRFAGPVSEVQFVTFSPTTYSSQMVVDDLSVNPPRATPEPAGLAALGLGLTGFVCSRRRRGL